MKVISCSLLSCIGCLCLLQLGCGRRDKGTSQAGSLPSLPVSLSEYCGDTDWERQEVGLDGLPEGVRCVRYTGEFAWLEVFTQEERLLYVRRKWYHRPSIFGPTEVGLSTLIMIDMKKATKREVDDFGGAFIRWMWQALRDFDRGWYVDTRFTKGDLCVCIRSKDLIVEYAKTKTMHALEEFAHGQKR